MDKIVFTGNSFPVRGARQFTQTMRQDFSMADRAAPAIATEFSALRDRLREHRALDALGQLSGQVAHDFNNVLAVALCGVEVVDATIGDVGAKRLLANAAQSLERGRQLTEHLATAAHTAFVPESIDVHALIAAIRDVLSAKLGAANELRIRCDAVHRFALVNADLLGAALLNLAANAGEAMPMGGVWTLATCNAKTSGFQAQRDCLVITATDSGVGMPAEVSDHAFDLFFSTKSMDGYRGLGLAQVKDLAHRAGGFVALESEVGHGTVVRLGLPLSSPG